MRRTWVMSLDIMASLGIQVTPAMLDVLHYGGEVLVIHNVPDPGQPTRYGFFSGTACDQDDNLVHVASVMTSYPIEDPPPEAFGAYRDQYNHLSDYIDDELTSQWRFWPSYTGHYLSEEIAGLYGFSIIEAIAIKRLWSGIPVDDFSRDVAQAVVEATINRVQNSAWGALIELAQLEDDGETPPIGSNVDPENPAFAEYWRVKAELIEAGLWNAEMDMAYSDHIPMEPIEHLLVDNPTALALWQRLRVQSRLGCQQAFRGIPRLQRGLYQHQEMEFEPWF